VCELQKLILHVHVFITYINTYINTRSFKHTFKCGVLTEDVALIVIAMYIRAWKKVSRGLFQCITKAISWRDGKKQEKVTITNIPSALILSGYKS
jgi:hypothetical protein